MIPRQRSTYEKFEIVFRASFLKNLMFSQSTSGQVGESIDRIEQQSTPGCHVAGDDQHDGGQVLEQILVPYTDAMRFASLKFGVNAIQFDDDGTVTEAKAQLAEPRLDETAERGRLKVANDHLEM